MGVSLNEQVCEVCWNFTLCCSYHLCTWLRRAAL